MKMDHYRVVKIQLDFALRIPQFGVEQTELTKAAVESLLLQAARQRVFCSLHTSN